MGMKRVTVSIEADIYLYTEEPFPSDEDVKEDIENIIPSELWDGCTVNSHKILAIKEGK